MIDKTVVRKTNKVGGGLRTTIPRSVINLLHLEEDGNLTWLIEAIPGVKKNNVRVYVEGGN